MPRILLGVVCDGIGKATTNLSAAEQVIATKMGLGKLQPGTLNVRLPVEYGIPYDLLVTPPEYKSDASILKLKRCRLRGVRAVIVRPLEHETPGHSRLSCLELLSEHQLRTKLGLNTGDVIAIEIEGDEDWWRQPEPK